VNNIIFEKSNIAWDTDSTNRVVMSKYMWSC